MTMPDLRLTLLGLCFAATAYAQEAPDERVAQGNPLTYALAWKQTAAEYQALYYQGFNIARLHVEAALQARQSGDKPLAVITDVDDTVLHPLSYWGALVKQRMDFFDDALWDRWVEANQVTATPGALAFLEFCARNGVEVFYVTSRDQGEQTEAFALANLTRVGFPFADANHVTVLRDSSNKEPRQDAIMADYQVVVMLGDSLNDFRRKFYVRGDIEGRIAVMEEDRDKFGHQYVVFPNPTDGHWLAAIFGDSEPPPTQENRAILEQAASRQQWRDELDEALAAYTRGDVIAALSVWRAKAEEGNARAQNNLGILYRNGEGVVQDLTLAREWLLRAADQGHARAQFSLGMMYDYGQGVAQDPQQALRWYERAAASGDSDAQFNLGVLYAQGRGVSVDLQQAAQWYARAAERGHANAQNILGQMTLAGEGVPQDREKAKQLFEQAAAQQHEDAVDNLARYFP